MSTFTKILLFIIIAVAVAGFTIVYGFGALQPYIDQYVSPHISGLTSQIRNFTSSITESLKANPLAAIGSVAAVASSGVVIFSKLRSASNQIARNDQTIKSKQLELAQLASQYQDLASQKDKLEKLNDTLQGQLNTLTSTVNNMQEQFGSKTETLYAEVTKKLGVYQSQVSDLKTQVSQLQEINKDIRGFLDIPAIKVALEGQKQ